jgi:hypothetical protein
MVCIMRRVLNSVKETCKNVKRISMTAPVPRRYDYGWLHVIPGIAVNSNLSWASITEIRYSLIDGT